MDNKEFPVLYILMRNDLDSLNPGKAMAQASHASNAFLHYFNTALADNTYEELVEAWMNQTPQGFGTVLVLGVTEQEMRTAVDVANRCDFLAQVVNDPTYPVRDGSITHFMSMDTCAFVFGDKNDNLLKAILGNFNLHP